MEISDLSVNASDATTAMTGQKIFDHYGAHSDFPINIPTSSTHLIWFQGTGMSKPKILDSRTFSIILYQNELTTALEQSPHLAPPHRHIETENFRRLNDFQKRLTVERLLA
jgi:hypothetical protein